MDKVYVAQTNVKAIERCSARSAPRSTKAPGPHSTAPSFAPPETGKIAVKVINHYGDEVLKVFTV